MRIVSESDHKEESSDLLHGIAAAQKAKLPFGVRLVRDPESLYDAFAIKVVGFWSDGTTEHEHHPGFIPKGLALKARNHLGDNPISARLIALEANGTDPLNVVVDFLEDA